MGKIPTIGEFIDDEEKALIENMETAITKDDFAPKSVVTSERVNAFNPLEFGFQRADINQPGYSVYEQNHGSLTKENPDFRLCCKLAPGRICFWAGEPKNNMAGQGSSNVQSGDLPTLTSLGTWVV